MAKSATERLCVKRQDVESLVICLAIGTLQAIDRGAIDIGAGIWCLGRPSFWEPLQEQGLVSAEVVEVLSGADELGAVGALCGTEVRSRAIHDAIATLEKRLRELPDPLWQATWVPDARTP